MVNLLQPMRIVLTVLALLFPGASEANARVDWPADFEALKAGLARNYANFEYTLTDRRIDLPTIAARYRVALDSAGSDAERRQVFERLLGDFRDPHLSIAWPSQSSKGRENVACPSDLAAAAASGGVLFHRLPAFEALASAEGEAFRAGVLRAKGRETLGIIRIGIFLHEAFSAACAEAAAEAGFEPDQPCDHACMNTIRRPMVQRLNRSLERVLRDLERNGAKRIVVDVTDNGGGSDWAEIVARMLAGPLRSSRVAMLKHSSWEAYLDALLPVIESRALSAAPDRRNRLERALRVLGDARRALAQPCDLSAAWTDRDLAMGRKPLPCTTLVLTEFYQTGVESGVPPPTYAPDDGALFRLAPFGPPPKRVTRLPIIILVNQGTHSAAEMFAAVLRDNRRATVVGAPTSGAACGTFTGAGTHFTLPGSGALVRVPDCVRLRADGRNERRGVVPDRIVPWAPSDSAYQRAQKALDALLVEPR